MCFTQPPACNVSSQVHAVEKRHGMAARAFDTTEVVSDMLEGRVWITSGMWQGRHARDTRCLWSSPCECVCVCACVTCHRRRRTLSHAPFLHVNATSFGKFSVVDCQRMQRRSSQIKQRALASRPYLARNVMDRGRNFGLSRAIGRGHCTAQTTIHRRFLQLLKCWVTAMWSAGESGATHGSKGPEDKNVDRDLMLTVVKVLEASPLKDRVVQQVGKALRENQLVEAKAQALAAFTSALKGWAGDMRALGDLEAKVDAVKGLAMNPEVVAAVLTFGCTLRAQAAALVTAATPLGPDDSGAIGHMGSILCAFEDMADVTAARSGQRVVHGATFLNIVQKGTEIKAFLSRMGHAFDNIKGVPTEDALAEAQSTAIRFTEWVATWKTFEVHAKAAGEGGPDVPCKSTVDIHAHIGRELAAKTEEVTTGAMDIIAARGKALANAKARLRRVAGGMDENKSWKATLTSDAQWGDAEMTAAVEDLGKAFCTAIEKRVETLKKDLGGFGESDFMIPSIHVWGKFPCV